MTPARIGDDEVFFGVFDARRDRQRLTSAFKAMSAAEGERGFVRDEAVRDSQGDVVAHLGVAGPARTPSTLQEEKGPVALREGADAAAGRVRLFAEGRGDSDPLATLARFRRIGGFDDGADGPSPVEGEFAAAFIDSRRRRLMLVRDPGGFEAIYSMEIGAGAVAFSTTPHALLALPGAPADPDMEAVRLQAWTSDEMPWRSSWPGIVCIAPGSLSVVSSEENERRRWWRPAPDPALAELGVDAFMDAFVERARTAAASRWTADPSSRAFVYSGGLDSSLALASVASRFPTDALPLVSVDSTLPAGAEDLKIQAAAARRFPGADRILVPAASLDPLDGVEAAWRRAASPNMDLFACATLGIARTLKDHGHDGGHGGFAGDFVVSRQSAGAVADALRVGRIMAAARLYSELRTAGMGRRRFARQLAAMWGPTRSLTRRPATWGLPPAPFLPSDAGQAARWREAGVDLRPMLEPGRVDEQARGLLRTSAQWPFRTFLGGGADDVVRVSSLMLDTRLTSAAMAAPLETTTYGGRSRGLVRRALMRMGFEEAALRGDKSALAPEIWGAARVGLGARREEMRAFQDLALWREHVDQPRVDALLGRVEDIGDVNELSVLLRAWHFGQFAMRAAERR